jgi:carboxyl-terminal processing protease
VRGDVRRSRRDFDGAERDFDAALEDGRDLAVSYHERAILLSEEHRYDEALEDIDQALALTPRDADLYDLRSSVNWSSGHYHDAIADLYGFIQYAPQSALAYNNRAWFRAVCPDPHVRIGAQAVEDATRACELSQWKEGGYVDTLAAAYAESGQFDRADEWQRKVIALADPHDSNLADYRQRLGLYLKRQAYHEEPPAAEPESWPALRFRTFKAVWSTVNDTYFDPTFGGVDWQAERARYRNRLVDATDRAGLRRLLTGMVGALRRTHFTIIPREAAVFDVSERNRVGSVGATSAVLPGGAAIVEVKAGSPAARAGLRPGEIVAKIDGVDLSAEAATLAKAGLSDQRTKLYVSALVNSRLEGAPGVAVNLEVLGVDGKRRTVQVVCGPKLGEWSEPLGSFPSLPMNWEARRDPDGIALFRFDAFLPQAMKPFHALLHQLRPGDGLIIDWRQNTGGILDMAPGIAGWLLARQLSFGTMHLRNGHHDLIVYPQADAFYGPVAVLIGSGSVSTSEVLAAGLQECRRARIFGEASPGAVLSSLFQTLPDGDLFQYAVADVQTAGGVMLEGEGVKPDEPIAVDRGKIAAGRDSVIEAARRWLGQQRHAPAARP